MKRILSLSFPAAAVGTFLVSASLIIALGFVAAAQPAQKAKQKPSAAKPRPGAAAPKTKAAPANEDELKAELEEIVKLPPSERVGRLEEFVKKNAETEAGARGVVFLTSARAALGDEKLRTGDRLAGVELFRAAVKGAPAAMPDKLFYEVVSQLPANLHVLGEQEAALDLARRVEAKVKDNPQRLLSIAAFYLGTERGAEAARVAEAAAALKPDFAAAYLALGAAHRFTLRLDDAARAFARARELDPASVGARRSLADLLRATGKPEEALALYREQLAADAKDAGARTGVVLSLFEAGKREEAERELQSALAEQPADLPLLVGAAYWYAANNEGARAAELAERAVSLEPRYRWVWSRVALARALLAQGKPLDAERALRPARSLGSFPTLDYELASVLASAGLYHEAAEELARSFTIKGGQIETRLAGSVAARASSFTELLAPERRAGLFQFKAADTEDNARVLKALLALHQATKTGAAKEKEATEAAAEFVAGEDAMRAYRQLYAAKVLTANGTAHRFALEATEAAKRGVDAALGVPHASVALFADDLYEVRARAISSGMTTTAPDAPPELLSKVMRGRIEDLAGWALLGGGDANEAVVRLRRAVSVLPENSIWWKAAQWHLGTALDASGNQRDALAAYVRSYRIGTRDPVRLAVIESLYRRINGSLDGLERLLTAPDAPAVAANRTGQPTTTNTPQVAATTTDDSSLVKVAAPEPTPTPAETTTANDTTTPANTSPTPQPTPAETPTPTPTSNETTPPTTTTIETPSPTPTPTTTESPAPTPTPSDERPAAARGAKGERKGAGGGCALTVNEGSVSIAVGGSVTLVVRLENYTGPQPPRLNVSTPNWADIIILAEPRAAEDGDASRFTVTSTSKKTGAFNIAFASPCGKKQVTVNVQ